MNKLILGVFAAVVMTGVSWAQELTKGDKLPELDLEYITEEPETEGSPMIVEFWATWCPPCLESIPHLNELAEKYEEDGLVVIGVSNEDAKTIKAFMKKTPMNYTVATQESGELATQLGFDAIPNAIVVDKTGKIVWVGSPFDLNDKIIEKVLK